MGEDGVAEALLDGALRAAVLADDVFGLDGVSGRRDQVDGVGMASQPCLVLDLAVDGVAETSADDDLALVLDLEALGGRDRAVEGEHGEAVDHKHEENGEEEAEGALGWWRSWCRGAD